MTGLLVLLAAIAAWRSHHFLRWTPRRLRALDGWQTERLVAALFRAEQPESHASATRGSGDGGIDVVRRRRRWVLLNETTLVQVKNYSGSGRLVGATDVRAFVRALRDQRKGFPCRGIFVSTTGYTTQARTVAKANGIILVDGQQLLDRLNQSGLKPWKLRELVMKDGQLQ